MEAMHWSITFRAVCTGKALMQKENRRGYSVIVLKICLVFSCVCMRERELVQEPVESKRVGRVLWSWSYKRL